MTAPPRPDRHDLPRPDRTAALRPCPHLGRDGDPDTTYLEPHAAHRCFAALPATSIDLAHQARCCFGDAPACARYRAATAADPAAPAPAPARLETAPSRPAGSATSLGTGGLSTTTSPAAPDRFPGPLPAAGAAPRGTSRDGTPHGRVGQAAAARPGAWSRLAAWSRRLSFEEWLVYGVTGALLVVILSVLLTSPPEPAAGANLGGRLARTLAGLEPTASPSVPPRPSATPRPQRTAPVGPPPTVVVPTPPQGGLVAALTPAERGVGSFDDVGRLPEFGERSLRVGRFDGRTYLGGILIPLGKLPRGARIAYVALELAGLSDSLLGGGGTWTVELLDPEAADDWANLTFDTLAAAPAAQMRTAWRIPARDLAARKVNVLEFSADARDVLMQRLAQGKVAFRVSGPGAGGDDLFAWDTGYGQGFGTRPVLRVAFVPPPPTPGPPPGQVAKPTPLPLVVWVADPTPAPSATPVPGEIPGVLRGMILFQSDRFGQTRLMVYDPAQGRVGQVTQSWPYLLAKSREGAAGQTAVRVEGKPCGGQTVRRDGQDVLVDPNDPARTCAQLVAPDPDSGAPREITQPGHMHYDPAVSPDGQWIAYTSDVMGNDEIFRIRPDGTQNTRLTDNVWEWDKHPSWSPDGSQIVFWSNRDGRKQLYVMLADGTGARNLSANGYNDWDPVWVK